MKLSKVRERLLDLTKSNKLLNFKEQKYTTLEIKYPSIDNLFNTILEGTTGFEFFNIEKVCRTKLGIKDLTKEDYDNIEPHISNLYKDNSLVFYKNDNSVLLTLKNIKKKTDEFIEEKGVNILYIALGFLNYVEDNVFYKAPLILIPVKVTNKMLDEYSITLLDEESIINPTLKYMLEDNYNIKLRNMSEVELPSEYFSYVENEIKTTNWFVSRESFLGLFSFIKINMYEDLKVNESVILKNPLITNLLGTTKKEIPTSDITPETYEVVDADNTQLEAIKAILRGESIVLEGPPGCGKSQTITNIISSLLMNGKKVLFVSEKQAALNVVYDKLKKTGLSEFSLELHSTKTNKKIVIEELKNTLLAQNIKLSNDAKRDLELKDSVDLTLSYYPKQLHTIIPEYNKTPYELYSLNSIYSKYNNYDYELSNLDYDSLNKSLSLIDEYIAYSDIIDYDYRNYPFYGYKDLSKGKASIAKNILLLNRLLDFLKGLVKNINSIKDYSSIDVSNINEYIAVNDFFNVLKNSKYINNKLFDKKNLDTYIEQIRNLDSDSNIIKSYKSQIKVYYNEDIYKPEYTCLLKELETFKDKKIKIFNKDYRNIMKRLKEISINNKSVSYAKTLDMLSKAIEVNNKSKSFDSNIHKDILKESYNGYNTDFKNILDMLDGYKDIINVNSKINVFEVDYTEISNKLNESLKDVEVVTPASKLFDDKMVNVLKFDIRGLFNKVNGIINNYDYLNSWFDIKNLLDRLIENNMLDYINLCLDNNVKLDDFKNVYLSAYYNSVVNTIIKDNEHLKSFNYIQRNLLVDDFIKLDRKSFEINRLKIKEALNKSKPNKEMIATNSSVAVILREAEKKRKQMSIRELLSKESHLIQTIKPCFLMSPLSVSTYLECGGVEFDCVIFDEASQIFPEDALGAIYRAKQMVVVGDSKQMPPTNFFNQVDKESNDEQENIGDFESILDISNATLTKYALKWHYRSKNENLIAFSNDHFYNGELVTFPNAKASCNDFGIEYIHLPDGRFSHTTRVNVVEAQYITNLIKEHYTKYNSTRSLGIIAFSISQQAQIDRAINSNPELLKLIEDNNNPEEPFFIKNLETVQGDERDTIIFSIGYGFDENNRFIQNFGPLNKEGGERRLNVAISRAKVNLKVVASIHGSDVKASAKGAYLLGQYLTFCEQLNDKAVVQSQKDNDFVYTVKDYLEQNGYKVAYKVGYSSVKIDLCIYDGNSDNFVYAIECDGDNYNKANTCREQNRLRKDNLERMGFKFIRIYSTSWYKDPTYKKELLNMLSSSIKEPEESIVDYNDEVIENSNETIFFDEYNYLPDQDINNIFVESNMDNVVKSIIEVEGPVTKDYIVYRISNVIQDKDIIKNLKSNLDLSIALSGYDTTENDTVAYDKSKEIKFRVPKQDQKSRDIKYIPLTELKDGMINVIMNNREIEKIDLFNTIRKLLKYQRKTPSFEVRLEEAYKLLVDDKLIKIVNGKHYYILEK